MIRRAALLITVALLPTVAFPQSPPPTSQIPAAAQRPARSSNASTTAAGYMELEAGIAVDENAFDSPLRLKFGLTSIWEAYLDLSPIVRDDVDGVTKTGFGDTRIGAKVRFFESTEGDAAIEAFVKIPTASEERGLGTGDTDAGFRFIASRSWGRNEFDFNLGGEFAGVPESTSNDARWTTILNWTRHVGNRTRFYGELFVQFLPAADVENITTDWGLSYAINPSFVLDGGINIGLSDDAPDVQIFFGLTKVLGRVFTPAPRNKD